MSDDNAFRFLPPGQLVDGDLELILAEKRGALGGHTIATA